MDPKATTAANQAELERLMGIANEYAELAARAMMREHHGSPEQGALAEWDRDLAQAALRVGLANALMPIWELRRLKARLGERGEDIGAAIFEALDRGWGDVALEAYDLRTHDLLFSPGGVAENGTEVADIDRRCEALLAKLVAHH